MNIIVCINDAYVYPCINMLLSIRKHCEVEKINVYVLSTSLSNKKEKYLKKNLEKNNFEIEVIRSSVYNLPSNAHFSIDMYLRLFAFDLLPNVDKALYLDADIIVNMDIRELYNQNIEDKLVAAVEDYGFALNYKRDSSYWVNKNRTYLNSGVVLFNLDLFRKKISIDNIIDIVNKYKEQLLYPDQDVLNLLLLDSDFVVLDEHFNNQISIKRKEMDVNNSIVHYIGNWKPWNHLFKRKQEYLYWKNLYKNHLFRIALFNCFNCFFYPLKKMLNKIFKK